MGTRGPTGSTTGFQGQMLVLVLKDMKAQLAGLVSHQHKTDGQDADRGPEHSSFDVSVCTISVTVQ